MDCAVGERSLEGGVDESVLLDQREPGEARARDDDLEVVAAARAVLHVELGRVGEGLGEELAERGRSRSSSPRIVARAVSDTAMAGARHQTC